MTTTIMALIAASALTGAGLVWLVAARGPCMLLGRSCPSDGFEDRFDKAQRTFLTAVQPRAEAVARRSA